MTSNYDRQEALRLYAEQLQETLHDPIHGDLLRAAMNYCVVLYKEQLEQETRVGRATHRHMGRLGEAITRLDTATSMLAVQLALLCPHPFSTPEQHMLPVNETYDLIKTTHKRKHG